MGTHGHSSRRLWWLAPGLLLAGGAYAQSPADSARLDALQREIAAQTERLEGLKRLLAEQEGELDRLRGALDEQRLDTTRAKGREAARSDALTQVPLANVTMAQSVLPESAVAQAAPTQDPMTPAPEPQPDPAVAQQPVGRAPESDTRPPEIAQIFEQPGVLTPPGKFVLEPSLEFDYSANGRVALVGFTIIPAILIGLIDVRQIKATTAIATLTGRYGVSKRFELEAQVPYVYSYTDTISREIFTGTAVDNVFESSGHGLGDIELTARYQINQGGPDRPFWVGWLRYKSRTGKDLFEVVTDCVTRCVANATGTGLPLELPTGSGFESLQPGVTWLYPSDPVVFFGSFSYLHNFERSDVSRTVLGGVEEPIGDVKAGDIIGFNLGMGLALNEKAAISLGYDQSTVGRTQQNGEDAPGSVRVVLGTLLLGGSYRFNDRVSLNVALGVGVTRDTPDMTLTARVPISF